MDKDFIAQYNTELNASIHSSFKNTAMENKDIISIIFEYGKIEIGKLKFYDFKHMTLPLNIEIENENPSNVTFQQIEMSEISKDFHLLFIDKLGYFGDIVLFDDSNYGFVDGSTLWIARTNEYLDSPYTDSYNIAIPKEITEYMRDAGYFYDIQNIVIYPTTNNYKANFKYIELTADDLWLRQKLQIPINEKLSLDWKYRIHLDRSGSQENVGDLIVSVPNANEINEINERAFKINTYCTVNRMKEYFEHISEPKISFKVHFIGDYKMHVSLENISDDLLPFQWDRKKLYHQSRYLRYQFTAPIAQITQQNILNVEHFLEPMEREYYSWEDVFVVVGIAIIYSKNKESDFQLTCTQLRDTEDKFKNKIFDIFGGWDSFWKLSSAFGQEDHEIRKKHNVSGFRDRFCDVYYGPKCELNEKLEELQIFMESDDNNKTLQHWIKFETFDVIDPLSVIPEINY